MRSLLFALLLAPAALLPAETTATLAKQAAPAAAASSSAAEDSAVVAAEKFLTALEAKNAEMTSLQADFDQVRADASFLDEVRSEGTFWYQAPKKFRASYRDKNSSEIWISEGRFVSYVPKLKQVEIARQAQGEDAGVSQLLLGFGVKVAEIRKIFTFRELRRAEGNVVIEFVSKDVSRSLQFKRIVITFDQATLLPERLELEDQQSVIRMDLKNIRLNPKLKDSIFKEDWPKDVDVVEYD